MKAVPDDQGTSLRLPVEGPHTEPSRAQGHASVIHHQVQSNPREESGGNRASKPCNLDKAIVAASGGTAAVAEPELRMGAQHALSISLADIIGHSPEAFLVADRDWRIVYLNQAAARMSGKGPEEFLHRFLWEAWPALAGTDIERQCRSAMEKSQPVRLEHLDDNGRDNWLEIQAYPCAAGLALHYRDITDRKRVEAESHRREEELTEFFENAAVGLHWVGPDGTILWANNAELRLLGYSPDEYIGRNIAEFHVDDAVIKDILERLTNNEVLNSYEARMRCKDRSIRYVSINSNVLRENGRFVHTRCFTRDITDKKRAEEAQNRLAAIVESSSDAIISKDLQGNISSWNAGAERLFGYKAQEVIGKSISILIAPDRPNEMPNILARIVRGERVEHYETKRRTKDGRIITVSLTISPIYDGSGKIIGASKVARDISERERAQAALRETNDALLRANADLEQFAYSASHDLQEPLRMVAIYSEMLKKKYAGQLGPQGDQYINFAVEGAARMRQLIQDLLAYTRASTLIELPADHVDARQPFRNAVSNLNAAIEQSGAVITRSDLPHVPMHEVPLEHLFQNLLGNALKYRVEVPPRIHVSAERCGSEWLFAVSDNGIGIDAQYNEQIFGIFKRLHSAQRYSGTGMGLAICKTIVERYGGRIWVESEPGKGSTFFFTVPDRKTVEAAAPP